MLHVSGPGQNVKTNELVLVGALLYPGQDGIFATLVIDYGGELLLIVQGMVRVVVV